MYDSVKNLIFSPYIYIYILALAVCQNQALADAYNHGKKMFKPTYFSLLFDLIVLYHFFPGMLLFFL